MFEELRDDQNFRLLTQDQRQQYLADYQQKVVVPKLDAVQANEEKRQKVQARVEQEFAKVAYKTNWDLFKDAALDLAMTPARAAVGLKELSLPIEHGIANVMDSIAGGTAFAETVNQRAVALKRERAMLTVSPDAVRWNDAAFQGMATGGLISKFMYQYSGMAANWAQQFLASTAQTESRAVATSMLTEGVENLVTEAAMAKFVEPAIEKTDWSKDVKAGATLASYFALGFGGGLTYGYAMDRALGNPMFTRTLNNVVEKAAKGPVPNLTKSENLLWHLTADPENLRRLGSAFKEADAQYKLQQENLKGLVNLDTQSGMPISRATMLASDIKLQNLITSELSDEAANVARRKAAGLPIHGDLTDAQNSKMLATMIQQALDLTAARRAAEKLRPDYHVEKLAHETGPVAEVLSGKKIQPVSETPVEGASTSQPGVSTEGAPAVAQPSAPTIKWFARLDSQNKILLRANTIPPVEVLQQLREVGLFWQSKKYFDPQDPNTKGVFYGPNTPEAHAKIRELFEQQGQPVAKKPIEAAEQKPIDPVNPVKQAEPVVQPTQNKLQAKAKNNEELGQTTRPPVLPQTPEAKKLGQTIKSAQAAKDVKATNEALPVEQDKFLLSEEWQAVTTQEGQTLVTATSDRVHANHRWINETTVQKRYPQAYQALTSKLGVRSIKEGFTFDDVMRTTVNAYNKFKPGEVSELEIEAHLKQLDELETLLESGWKDQPRLKRGTNDLNNAYRKLVDEKLITPSQYKSITKVLQNFKLFPDFTVSGLHGENGSFFGFLNNTMYLRRADDFFHETGHWVWLHGLTKQDRLDFFKKAMTKYGSQEDWDALWPTREKFRQANAKDNVTYPDKLMRGHFQNTTEMFADLFRRYVHTYHMPDVESADVLSKMLKMVRAIYKPMLELGDEIPKDMRRFVEKVVNAPVPKNNKLRLAQAEDLVQRTALYQDRETFLESMRSLLDDEFAPTRQRADAWLMEVLGKNKSAFEAFNESGSDLEGILQRVYKDVLAFHHLDVGNEQNLEKVLESLRRVFDSNDPQDVLERLKVFGTQKVTSKYGVATEDSTMPGVLDAGEAGRQFASRSAKEQEFIESGAKVQLAAMKQFYNDLGALYQASKYYKKQFPKSGMNKVENLEPQRLAREEWAELQMRLADEELFRRAESNAMPLDSEGLLDDFNARPKYGYDEDEGNAWGMGDDVEGEAFENAFKGFNDSDIRLIQLELWPQLVSLGAGLQSDDENGFRIPGTNISIGWSLDNWVSNYGPAISTYFGLHKGIRGKIKQGMLRKWEALTPSEKEVIVRKWNGVTKHQAVRIWREGDGLDKGMQKLLKQQRLNDTKVRRQFFDLASELNKKLTIEEQRAVAEIITKQGDLDVSQASPKVKASAQLVENLFSGVKKDLLDAGVPEHMLSDFGQGYLPQIFERQAKTWWGQSLESRRLRNIYDSINAKFLAPRGIVHKLNHSEKPVQQLIQNIKLRGKKLEQGMLVDEFLGLNGERMLRLHEANPTTDPLRTWKVQEFSTQKGSLTLHRPYDRLERQLLKEETSVVPRLVEFGKQSSKLIAQSRTMQNIARNKDLTIDPARIVAEAGIEDGELALNVARQRGWVSVPETESAPGIKRYGELAGKLVDPEAMYVLRNITSTAPEHPFLNKAFKEYRAGIGLWKIGKTAFNVTTHGINFIGNSAMCVLDGRNPLGVLWKGAREIKNKGQLYQQAVDAGMLDSNMLRSELGLDDFMRSMEKMPNRHATEGMESAVSAWMHGVSNGAKKVGKAAAYWPMRIYELGDQVYKLGVFAQEFEMGKSADEALEQANRLFFDYSNVPTGVRFLRDWGVVPFLSYTYKLVPRMVDFAVNNPHRLLGLLGTLQLANELVMHQEWGEDFGDVQKWQQEMMPDWMNRGMFGTSKRGGIMTKAAKNEYGHEYTQWLDYSQVIPGADLLNDGGIFRGLPFGTNPILSIVAGLANNKDQVLGNEIAPYPEAEAPELKKRNTEARLKFIMRTLLPNLPVYPGAYSLERLGQALTGSGVIDKETADQFGWTGMDYYGTREDIGQEMFGYVTGIRSRRLYATQETIRGIEKNKFGMKKEENELRHRLADRRTSPSEQQAQIDKYRAIILHNQGQIEHLGEVYRKAQRAIAPQEKVQ